MELCKLNGYVLIMEAMLIGNFGCGVLSTILLKNVTSFNRVKFVKL